MSNEHVLGYASKVTFAGIMIKQSGKERGDYLKELASKLSAKIL